MYTLYHTISRELLRQRGGQMLLWITVQLQVTEGPTLQCTSIAAVIIVNKQNCDTQTNKWERSAASGLYDIYQQMKDISQICRSWGLESSVLTWLHASSRVSRYSSQTIKPSRTGWHPPQWKSNPIIAGAQSIPNLRATRFKPGTATKYKYLQKLMVTTWIMHP